MKTLSHLFERNRQWAARIEQQEPGFFAELARQQTPEYLWIGCADSRVPANQIIDFPPGKLFVHRNIANVVVHSDVNCLSVVQFAVDVLQVKHIIICGHYGCGGVAGALEDRQLGLVDLWLRHIQDVARHHQAFLASLADSAVRRDALCALNVIEQVGHLGRTTTVRAAWGRGQSLSLHSWIYDLHDGLLQDLGMHVTASREIDSMQRKAVAAVRQSYGQRE